MQNCYNQEQSERLTTKHIHTLKFLQEIVDENKKLKDKVDELEQTSCRCSEMERMMEENQARIQEVQEQYMKRADEINLMLTEKHKAEMMKKVEDQIDAEKGWLQTKEKLQSEIDLEKKEIIELRRHLADAKQHKGNVQIYELKVAALEQEINRLQEERKKLDSANQGQSQQLRKLEFYEDQNKSLKDELVASNQKIKELEFKIRKLEKDLSDQGASEQDEILAALKNKLQSMHKDKLSFDEKEKERQNFIEDLKAENGKLRRALDDSERMRMELRSQMEQLMEELSVLRKQAMMEKDKQTFKDFVLVKRELALLKEENDELKIKLKFPSSKVLPSLKGAEPNSGTRVRVSSAKGDRRKKETLPFSHKS